MNVEEFQAMGKPIIVLPSNAGNLKLTVCTCIICGTESISFGSNKNCVCPKCKESLDNGYNIVLEVLSDEEKFTTVGRAIMLPEEIVNSQCAFVTTKNTEEFEELYKLWQAKNG